MNITNPQRYSPDSQHAPLPLRKLNPYDIYPKELMLKARSYAPICDVASIHSKLVMGLSYMREAQIFLFLTSLRERI